MKARRSTGNQYGSRKANLMFLLRVARGWLNAGELRQARLWLSVYRKQSALVPSSTRRRWKCGQ